MKKYSQLTGSNDYKILKTWSCVVPYYSGAAISATNVYSITSGKVVYVGYNGNTYAATIQINSTEYVRYCNMYQCNVSEGQEVTENLAIGICKEYVHFEYCTKAPMNSPFCCRLHGDVEIFKQDPSDLLEGNYTAESNQEVYTNTSAILPSYKFSAIQNVEFFNNRGDHIVEF